MPRSRSSRLDKDASPRAAVLRVKLARQLADDRTQMTHTLGGCLSVVGGGIHLIMLMPPDSHRLDTDQLKARRCRFLQAFIILHAREFDPAQSGLLRTA